MRRRLASVGTTQIVSRMVRAVRRTRFPPAGAGLAWLRNLYGVPAGSRARYRAGTRPGCAASRTPACLTAPSPHKTSRCYMTRRADFCRRVTLYTREIRRGGRKDTRLWPKLYMIFASSFVVTGVRVRHRNWTFVSDWKETFHACPLMHMRGKTASRAQMRKSIAWPTVAHKHFW